MWQATLEETRREGGQLVVVVKYFKSTPEDPQNVVQFLETYTLNEIPDSIETWLSETAHTKIADLNKADNAHSALSGIQPNTVIPAPGTNAPTPDSQPITSLESGFNPDGTPISSDIPQNG